MTERGKGGLVAIKKLKRKLVKTLKIFQESSKPN